MVSFRPWIRSIFSFTSNAFDGARRRNFMMSAISLFLSSSHSAFARKNSCSTETLFPGLVQSGLELFLDRLGSTASDCSTVQSPLRPRVRDGRPGKPVVRSAGHSASHFRSFVSRPLYLGEFLGREPVLTSTLPLGASHSARADSSRSISEFRRRRSVRHFFRAFQFLFRVCLLTFRLAKFPFILSLNFFRQVVCAGGRHPCRGIIARCQLTTMTE